MDDLHNEIVNCDIEIELETPNTQNRAEQEERKIDLRQITNSTATSLIEANKQLNSSIIVADDQHLNMVVLLDKLKDLGVSKYCHEFYNGADALQLAKDKIL